MAKTDPVELAKWLRWRMDNLGSKNADFVAIPRAVLLEIAQMLEDSCAR